MALNNWNSPLFYLFVLDQGIKHLFIPVEFSDWFLLVARIKNLITNSEILIKWKVKTEIKNFLYVILNTFCRVDSS